MQGGREDCFKILIAPCTACDFSTEDKNSIFSLTIV